MKNKTNNLLHLKGEKANKIYWEQFYQCQSRFSSVMVIDLNLEIVVDANHTLLAFRHDLPVDMQGMDRNCGKWQGFLFVCFE